ncbi:hypothetical protein MKK63_02975 [Methylobacterium sp. J-088]|uniref:hypothetical protein n=1 Tax=Methylobacterium sp. J-088 TaxID=2836664 RepID=UPI001FB8BF4E|nr:hypothetical protein [Methylobacterium sp. J-088]MCJ2061675.1 hypothetical protein [Methylobacterium sp. J-088]
MAIIVALTAAHTLSSCNDGYDIRRAHERFKKSIAESPAGKVSYNDRFSESYINTHFSIGQTTIDWIWAFYGIPGYRDNFMNGDVLIETYLRSKPTPSEFSRAVGGLGSEQTLAPQAGDAPRRTEHGAVDGKPMESSSAPAANAKGNGDMLQMVFKHRILIGWRLY